MSNHIIEDGSTEFTKEYKPPKYDFIIRKAGSSLNNLQIKYIYSTSTFRNHFKYCFETFLEVIDSQKKQLDYNGYYTSFLLGQISSEEFEKISEKFVIKPKKISEDQLKLKVGMIINFLGEETTPKDISQYIQCSEEDAINTLKLLHLPSY